MFRTETILSFNKTELDPQGYFKAFLNRAEWVIKLTNSSYLAFASANSSRPDFCFDCPKPSQNCSELQCWANLNESIYLKDYHTLGWAEVAWEFPLLSTSRYANLNHSYLCYLTTSIRTNPFLISWNDKVTQFLIGQLFIPMKFS